jgi:hypothetical protein
VDFAKKGGGTFNKFLRVPSGAGAGAGGGDDGEDDDDDDDDEDENRRSKKTGGAKGDLRNNMDVARSAAIMGTAILPCMNGRLNPAYDVLCDGGKRIPYLPGQLPDFTDKEATAQELFSTLRYDSIVINTQHRATPAAYQYPKQVMKVVAETWKKTGYFATGVLSETSTWTEKYTFYHPLNAAFPLIPAESGAALFDMLLEMILKRRAQESEDYFAKQWKARPSKAAARADVGEGAAAPAGGAGAAAAGAGGGAGAGAGAGAGLAKAPNMWSDSDDDDSE